KTSPEGCGSSLTRSAKGSPSAFPREHLVNVSLVLRDHAIDDSVFLRLLRAHEVVALGVLLDFIDRFARMVSDDLVEPPTNVDDLLRVDLDVRRLTLEAG